MISERWIGRDKEGQGSGIIWNLPVDVREAMKRTKGVLNLVSHGTCPKYK
jgi:hypothetical protein